MNNRFVVLSLCLSLALPPANALAQGAEQVNQSWDVLRQLLVEENLQIETKDDNKSSGRFISYSDMELLVRRGNKTESFNRNDVKRVWSVVPPSRTKRAVFAGLGALGGFIAGLTIAVSLGFKDCGGSCTSEKTGIIAALIGLPAAGLIGGRALAGRGERTLLYSAP